MTRAARAAAGALALVAALAVMPVAGVPAAAEEPSAGAAVIDRYDRVVARLQVPPDPAAPLRERVQAIVRYAGMGADHDARLRLRLFRDRVGVERRQGDLTVRQARALKRFSRRAAEALGL
ncbi:hypothetical protein [Nocardioides sp. SYSU DS0663]|uniref:hypothetical protein n=1 Tax=Nocardioides sp. SYSU DS0663 TaxID=3416445 RepID=UPI003F4C622A